MKGLISKKQADAILAADLKNVIRKVERGVTLTKEDRRVIAQANGESAQIAHTYKELAEILGITKQGLHRWRQIEGAPRSENGEHDIDAWRRFRALHGLKGYTDDEVLEEVDGMPTLPILQRRKLKLFCDEKEIQLAARRAELIEAETVREFIAKKAEQSTATLRGMLDMKLARKLSGKEAADIHEALVAVGDEFIGLLASGK